VYSRLDRRTIDFKVPILVGIAVLGCTAEIRPRVTDVPASAKLDVIFVATDLEIVNAMLALARVARNDVVYDLGSGDGRIVIAAAKEFGARGVGVDLDPQRIREAQGNAVRAGVSHRVTFRVQTSSVPISTPRRWERSFSGLS